MKLNRRHPFGFTLIELLVVVAIIALLIAILLPSLGKARKQAKNVTCLANLKSDGTGLYNYAMQYNGRLPYDGVTEGDLFWDMEGNMTDTLMGTNGLVHKTYYCPLNVRQDVDNLWAVSGGAIGSPSTHRALGYFYLIMRDNKSAKNLTLPKYSKVTVNPRGMPDDGELITDITIQDPGSQAYVGVHFSGGGGVNLSTSHVTASDRPSNTNILFLDGHADGRPFGQMKAQINSSTVGATDSFIEFF